MRESYSLTDIEAVTGIAYEKLRYVIDQKLLPGDRRMRELSFSGSQGRGTARTYTPFSAFGVACAALLLEAGLKRVTTEKILDCVCRCGPGPVTFDSVPLYQAFQKRDLAILEIGDHVNIRLHGTAHVARKELETGWIQVETRAHLEKYEPMITVRINVAKLRSCFMS